MFNKLKQKWREDIYMLETIERPNRAVDKDWGFIKLFFHARTVRKLLKYREELTQ